MAEPEREAYTEAHAARYPPEYLAGIDLYNAGEFHAAHDAWEERWRDECGPQEKLFLQAMIQSAVVFHHIEIGRRGAARRMYGMALEKFERLGAARFMSLDITDYLAQLARALSWLEAAADPRDAVPPVDFAPPRIRLLPGAMDYD
jgi:predicted metal-dependent hydrolase